MSKTPAAAAKREHKKVRTASRREDARDSAALFLLGIATYRGDGVVKDRGKAAQLFQRAVDAGNTDALLWLARCYNVGGVGLEEDKAVQLYERALTAGDTKALFWLARCYDYGGVGLEVDKGKAVPLYERAADKGVGAAMLRLGCCYRDGNGVNVDTAILRRYGNFIGAV